MITDRRQDDMAASGGSEMPKSRKSEMLASRKGEMPASGKSEMLASHSPPPLEGGDWGEGWLYPPTMLARTPPPAPLPQGEGENFATQAVRRPGASALTHAPHATHPTAAPHTSRGHA